jgi:trigger factor
LKIETQPLEDHQVKLTVEVEPESFEEAKRRAARQIAKRTKIPGFRPGKAPYNIVQRYIGEEAIVEESLELLVRDLYPKIIEEAGIEPYGPGKLDNMASLEPLTLEFTVPLAAEVELGDYRSIRIPYERQEITDEDVEKVVENLRRRQAVEEPVERPAVEGDRVYFKLSGRRLDVVEGEDPTLIQERSTSVVIESAENADRSEWPFPGFSRRLIGMSAGESETFRYTFPEDWDYESMRGKEAEFGVTIEQVKAIELPELNDEFAQSVGDQYADVAALQADIRAGLEGQARESYDAEYDEQILSQLLESSTVKYPPQMLDNEIEEVLHQLEHRLKAQNLDLETYRKTRDLDEAGLREEARPVAESRLKRSLILLEISQAEKIEVDKDDLQSETERTLQAMTRFMSEAEMRKLSSQELIPNLVGNILAEMRINRTLERMRQIASGDGAGLPDAAEEETAAAEVSAEASDAETKTPVEEETAAKAEAREETPEPLNEPETAEEAEAAAGGEPQVGDQNDEEAGPPIQSGESPGE